MCHRRELTAHVSFLKGSPHVGHHTVSQSFPHTLALELLAATPTILMRKKMGAACVCVYVCTYTHEQLASHFFVLQSTHALNSGNRLYCGCARVALLALRASGIKPQSLLLPHQLMPQRERCKFLCIFWVLFIRRGEQLDGNASCCYCWDFFFGPE